MFFPCWGNGATRIAKKFYAVRSFSNLKIKTMDNKAELYVDETIIVR